MLTRDPEIKINVYNTYTPPGRRVACVTTVVGSIPTRKSTQHVISPEFGGKWGTECLNTRFLQPTLPTAMGGIEREAKFLQYL